MLLARLFSHLKDNTGREGCISYYGGTPSKWSSYHPPQIGNIVVSLSRYVCWDIFVHVTGYIFPSPGQASRQAEWCRNWLALSKHSNVFPSHGPGSPHTPALSLVSPLSARLWLADADKQLAQGRDVTKQKNAKSGNFLSGSWPGPGDSRWRNWSSEKFISEQLSRDGMFKAYLHLRIYLYNILCR